ncbi:MAG: YceI family protein [Stellaceae bacterium]
MSSAISAHANVREYQIDQRHGSIGFSVRQLGIFTVDGRFTRFTGRLAIDQDHPTETRIDVTIEAGSASMAWSEAVAMLRSPDYFDVARYPAIHFVSRSVSEVANGHFVINGVLTIRGSAHPQSLDATLVDERTLPGGAHIADFSITGEVQRFAYGMVANRDFVGDIVHLTIAVRLTLDPPNHAN